jgi:ribosomal protein S18 acetylase RimI-like enzyme
MIKLAIIQDSSFMDKEQLIILPATADERIWAARLLSESEPWTTLGISFEKCLQTCNDAAYQLFIARLGNVPCGVIIIDPHGVAGSPYIKSIVVSESYRDKRIGAALIHFAEALFKSSSRYIFLCVSSFNTRARSFYQKLGYTEIGELKDYIIDGASEMLMSKRLS